MNIYSLQSPLTFKDSDEHAIYYIIVVLLFYSFGIVFMMVKYMKKEREELEETKMYKEYVKAARDRCTQSKFVPTNRLALTALNTVNVISQPYDEERITFV
jgi:archaellum biogenesis protein FlaJ (TadC family)